MKIYTKTGDNGTTSLVGGKRVSKADVRLEAYGTADELNSFIGLLRAKTNEKLSGEILDFIQNKLFNLGTLLATEKEEENKQWLQDLFLSEQDVINLEQWIDRMNEDLPVIHSFILPAGNERVALCHVCRTIARRLERRMTALFYDKQNSGDNTTEISPHAQNSLKFVNRLSDFFFILAKKTAKDDQCDIFLWKK